MNIFKTFGLKKDTSYGDASEEREIKEMEEFFNEQEKEKKRYGAKGIDDMIAREQDEEWARDTDEHFAAQEEADRPEAGVPVKGRGLPQKYYSDRPRPSAEGEVPGRTDFLDEKQYTKRPKGQTLADKRAGRAVLNMFKVFGLKKNEEEDEDEDKKKTPNGGENGD